MSGDNVSTSVWDGPPVISWRSREGRVAVRGGTVVLTVGKDGADVERRLAEGLLACPGCSGRLAGWGHARSRVIRGESGVGWRLRPRRAVCRGCGRTHVLLPVSVLARRAGAAAGVRARPGLAAPRVGDPP